MVGRHVLALVSRGVAGLVLAAALATGGRAAADGEVSWSSFLGGNQNDQAYGTAADGDGNVYATGQTFSSGWVSGGWDTTHAGEGDVFLVKLNGTGAHLWSTFAGGTGLESGRGVAVDGGGNVFVTGYTASSGWTAGGWDTTHNGSADGFVAKFSPAGAHLWSTYLGSAGSDYGYAIAVTSGGTVYATGHTGMASWVGGGWDTSFNGGWDGYVVKLSANGAHLWSTVFGGAGMDYGDGIAAAGSDYVYVTGRTSSSGWVSGGWNTVYGGGDYDGYVLKLGAAGAHLWSTYLGGAELDEGRGIAVDGAGNAHAVGTTNSAGWISGGWNTSHAGGEADAYLVALDGAGAHLWSTYLGGTGNDQGNGVAVNAAGDVYVAGSTYSHGWVNGGPWIVHNGSSDGFIVKLGGAGAHVWSAYLGGSGIDEARSVAVGGTGRVCAAGSTASEHWTGGGWDTNYGGGSNDGFVATIPDAGQTGSLQVALAPGGAVARGAQWRRTGTAAWLESGAVETGVAAGVWSVEFKDVAGYAPPAPHTLTVAAVAAAQDTGVYTVVSTDIGWGCYLGGADGDPAKAVAVDATGNVCITGQTESSGWVGGGADTSLGGPKDGYVVKLDPTGAHLWSTYLGGPADDDGTGIAVDGEGNIYAVGTTGSTGWVGGGYDSSLGGATDGFAVKLSSGGVHLWSTYAGGSGGESGYGAAVDGAGNLYLNGTTQSDGWTGGGWDASLGGTRDAFLVKMSPLGAHLWSTHLGGDQNEQGFGVAVDGAGNVCAAGMTQSDGWTSGGWDTSLEGASDGFVVKLDPSGAHLWSTHLGGAANEIAQAAAFDGAGNLLATGSTNSDGWTSNGPDSTLNGAYDAFVLKLDGAGAHLWSGCLGGSGAEMGMGIAAGTDGRVYLAGVNSSGGWAAGGWNSMPGGGTDGFLAALDGAGSLLWSSLIGGSGDDGAYAVAADGGAVYTTGMTASSDWGAGIWVNSGNGGGTGFVLKIIGTAPPAAPANPGVADIGADTLSWTWTDGSGNESGFKVWADTGTDAPATLRATTAEDTTSWVFAGLSPNTPHSFQAAATNPYGDSAKTDIFTAWTLAATPAAPVVGGATDSSLTLSIGAGDGNPDGTEYALQLDGTGQWVQGDGALGETPEWRTAAAWGTVTVGGLREHTGHAFAAMARNGAGAQTAVGPAASAMTLDATPSVEVDEAAQTLLDAFDALDMNQDGGLDRTEAAVQGGPTHAQFTQMDADGNGLLDPGELEDAADAGGCGACAGCDAGKLSGGTGGLKRHLSDIFLAGFALAALLLLQGRHP